MQQERAQEEEQQQQTVQWQESRCERPLAPRSFPTQAEAPVGCGESLLAGAGAPVGCGRWLLAEAGKAGLPVELVGHTARAPAAAGRLEGTVG